MASHTVYRCDKAGCRGQQAGTPRGWFGCYFDRYLWEVVVRRYDGPFDGDEPDKLYCSLGCTIQDVEATMAAWVEEAKS